MIASTLLLALATSAFAQSESAASSVVVSAVVSAVAGPSFSASAALSAQPSGIASASAVPSGSVPALTNTSYGYECSAGYSLTYGITNATYSGVDLATAVAYFSQWTSSAPGMVSESSGTNETGATRTYMIAGAGEPFNVTEVLVNATIDSMTGALHQVYNTTAPITIVDLTLASIFEDLQVYANATTGETTVQYFLNTCTSNQEQTIAALPAILSGATQYWASALTGAVQSGSMSMSMSMAPSSAGPLASASAAASSITAAPAGVVSSAAGALSSATAAILPSALPSLRARGRWA